MVFPKDDHLVCGLRMSSVGPANVTGSDVIHRPAAMDLAMKLHYLRGVYFFTAQAVEGLTVPVIKESMFLWLNDYYQTCGRFRGTESGRPYIKCNDCGVRIIEGKCDRTVEEWLEADDGSLAKRLTSQQVIGPEINFSPPFLIQVTYFKCGGMAMGFSWAHVLGDAFSASQCFNWWSRVLSGLRPIGHSPSPSDTDPDHGKGHNECPSKEPTPLSIKRVGSGNDHWVCPNETNMETFTVHLTPAQIAHLQSSILGSSGHADGENFPIFESICVALWQLIAKVREGHEPTTVTVCKDGSSGKRLAGRLSNSQGIGVVKTESLVSSADPRELLDILAGLKGDENGLIEEAVEKDDGVSDFVMYGANLTFVDLQDADFYGLRLKGHKPVFVNYMLQSIGEEGVVLVLPGPGDGDNGGGGRVITVTLPENQLLQLKGDLKKKILL